MDIYNIHPGTGEFLSAGVADPDPLEDGGFLIPAHAVTTAPPAAIAGHVCVWVNDAWAQVPDHRGETWWQANGYSVEVRYLGDPALVDLQPSKPPESVEKWRETASLSRPEFVNAVADLGMLTNDEAMDAAKGDWPASFNVAIAGLSATDQRRAKVDWAGAISIKRNADLIGQIIASPIPITDAQVDFLFGWTG